VCVCVCVCGAVCYDTFWCLCVRVITQTKKCCYLSLVIHLNFIIDSLIIIAIIVTDTGMYDLLMLVVVVVWLTVF